MPSPGRSLEPQVILGRGRLLPSAGCVVPTEARQKARLERNVVREAGLVNGGVVGMGPKTE